MYMYMYDDKIALSLSIDWTELKCVHLKLSQFAGIYKSWSVIDRKLHKCTCIEELGELHRWYLHVHSCNIVYVPCPCVSAWVMVFNVTFNNISVISWSVLLVEETRVSGEDHRPTASPWQTWSHNVVSSTPCHKQDSNSQL